MSVSSPKNKDNKRMNKTVWRWIGAALLLLLCGVSWLLVQRSRGPVLGPYIPSPMQQQAAVGSASAPQFAATAALAQSAAVPTWVSNAAWDVDTISVCWRQLGPFSMESYSQRQALGVLTNLALCAGLRPPHNGEELLMTVYGMTPTGEYSGLVFMVLGVTNEVYADMLLWAYTNFYFEARRIADLHDVYRDRATGKANCSLSAMRNIGTPALIDRVNKMQRMMRDAGDDLCRPGVTISPAKYPVEAREWLLDYPEPDVRYNMVYQWLISGRPETPELLDEWCRRINRMPDDFHLWAGDPNIQASKRHIVRYVKDLRAEYIRRYRRWQADGRKDHFNSGRYSDPWR